uniref:protein PRRC2A n=1 Tax=Erigeron canadensis TaxID=72917 RepID=UPI001CB91D91|nr:protein PRRC2A [Erigeron canadensis]
MGCCASTNKPTPSHGFRQHSSKSSRAPPPVDEELVKEVLSETTNPKHFNKIEEQPRKTTPRNSIYKIQNQRINNLEENNISGEVSGDVSEICSNMSETVSTTTFEEDVEVLRRRVTDRSPAKLRNRQALSGELRMTRNSPVKVKQQSPGRVRSGTLPGSEGYNRGPGFGSAGRQRPMPGSGPGSRSRSPANRMVPRQGGGGGGGARNGSGRSPSAKRRENSPGRFEPGLPDQVLKPEPPSLGLEGEDFGWGPVDRNEDELLDNPLVSLECFIFL